MLINSHRSAAMDHNIQGLSAGPMGPSQKEGLTRQFVSRTLAAIAKKVACRSRIHLDSLSFSQCSETWAVRFSLQP
jgi:hypothetical protein